MAGWFNVWELVRPSGMAAAYADSKDGGKIKCHDFTKEKVFDAVVLQDNSAGAINPQRKDAFKKFANQHSYDLRCFGIQPLPMMTWARKNEPEITAQLTDATTKVGNEANAMVIPVGVAFAEAIKLDPKLQLFRDDQTHPSPEGTYLAGCVTFATMFHQSPVGLPTMELKRLNQESRNFFKRQLGPQYATILVGKIDFSERTDHKPHESKENVLDALGVLI